MASIKHFNSYTTGKLPEKTQKVCAEALASMYREPSTRQCLPFKIVMERCHDLDLYRCYGQHEMDGKLEELETDLAVEHEAKELGRFAENAIVATGDRIFSSHTGLGEHDYDDVKFPLCSQSPAACIAAIQSALGPFTAAEKLCLATSEFKKAYDVTVAPAFQFELFSAVQNLIKAYCVGTKLDASQGQAFIKQLHDNAFEHKDELVKNVSGACMRLWTCDEPKLDGRAFYQIINELLRSDRPDAMRDVAVFCRGINALLVTRRMVNILISSGTI
jgi:hypothetical protein